MDANELKNMLVSREDYPDNSATLDTARRLLSFNGKAAEMLREWIEQDKTPRFEAVNGVDSEFLVSKLGMKSPALIIAYAMLEKDPQGNAEYLKNLADHRIVFHPEQKKD